MKRLINSALVSLCVYLFPTANKASTTELPNKSDNRNDVLKDGIIDKSPFILKHAKNALDPMLLAAHRSHSSHASHSSHRSGSSGYSTDSESSPSPVSSTPVRTSPITYAPTPEPSRSDITDAFTSPSQRDDSTTTNGTWRASQYYIIGMQQFKKDAFTDAQSNFVNAVKLDAKNWQYQYALAQALFRQNKYDESLSWLDMALSNATSPDDIQRILKTIDGIKKVKMSK